MKLFDGIILILYAAAFSEYSTLSISASIVHRERSLISFVYARQSPELSSMPSFVTYIVNPRLKDG